MKILLWPTLYLPNIGGLEKMTHSLALQLRKMGHEVLVLSNAEQAQEFSVEGIPVFTFPFMKALFGYCLPMIQKILSHTSALVEAFAPDILHIHGWFECFCFYQVRVIEKRTLPFCLTIHGFLEQKHYQTENCLRLWRRADAVNTVSHAMVPPFDHPNFQVIHNGLPLSQVPLKSLPHRRLLLVGRLTEEKCFQIALQAFKLLLPKYPDLKLTLIGDGPEYAMLSELAKRLEIAVEMPGFAPPEAIENFIDQSTLLLVPSSYESFSLVALEAALRARPVVASRVLGLKEVVEDEKTGLLVEPQNPEALAAAIDALLSNPVRMEQMGKSAFERASQFFTIEKTTTNYLRMYEQASRLRHRPCA